MAEELTEESWKRLSIHLVTSSALSGAAIGYFTTFIPFQWPINILVGAIVGGVLLGIFPALVFRMLYLQEG